MVFSGSHRRPGNECRPLTQIVITIAPRRCSVSTSRCASAACSIGNTRSTIDRIWPASIIVFNVRSSSFVSRAKANDAVLFVNRVVSGDRSMTDRRGFPER